MTGKRTAGSVIALLMSFLMFAAACGGAKEPVSSVDSSISFQPPSSETSSEAASEDTGMSDAEAVALYSKVSVDMGVELYYWPGEDGYSCGFLACSVKPRTDSDFDYMRKNPLPTEKAGVVFKSLKIKYLFIRPIDEADADSETELLLDSQLDTSAVVHRYTAKAGYDHSGVETTQRIFDSQYCYVTENWVEYTKDDSKNGSDPLSLQLKLPADWKRYDGSSVMSAENARDDLDLDEIKVFEFVGNVMLSENQDLLTDENGKKVSVFQQPDNNDFRQYLKAGTLKTKEGELEYILAMEESYPGGGDVDITWFTYTYYIKYNLGAFVVAFYTFDSPMDGRNASFYEYILEGAHFGFTIACWS